MNIWSKGRRYAATALVLSGLFGAGLTLSPMSQADPNSCMPGQIGCDGGDFGDFGDNSNQEWPGYWSGQVTQNESAIADLPVGVT